MPTTINNRRNLELGPCNVGFYKEPSAKLTTAISSPYGANNDITIEARRPGSEGNLYSIAYVAGAALKVTVAIDGLAITVTIVTGFTTAAQVRDEINQTAGVSGVIKAFFVSGNDGTGLVAPFAAAFLTGGSDTGVFTYLGFLGDDVSIMTRAELGALTGAQTGNVAQDKVVIGGSTSFKLPMKELSPENLALLPTATLFDDGVSKKRIEFGVLVGQSQRDRSVKLEIRPIIGGGETSDPKKIWVIPEASPSDAEVTISYTPTTQRVVELNWEAWPSETGRWLYRGDEF